MGRLNQRREEEEGRPGEGRAATRRSKGSGVRGALENCIDWRKTRKKTKKKGGPLSYS